MHAIREGIPILQAVESAHLALPTRKPCKRAAQGT